MRDKPQVVRALEIWSGYPRLEFVDALAAAHAEAPDMRLAAFDSDFDGFPEVLRWTFDDAT
jgi:hypothetical protein